MVVKVPELFGMGIGAIANEPWTKYVTEKTGESKDLVNGITALGSLFTAWQISKSGYTTHGYKFLESVLVGFGLCEIKELTSTLTRK